ncbi:high affinity immunoglobulin epsilon receptor subunit beta-like [Narcine bancroftii]|uniref:high affinity immunoglobulin epsilon receptor subunit beta-like n=1 Tax=Narcine bancroftii TaxID=1343680 RepID=UPI0038318F10
MAALFGKTWKSTDLEITNKNLQGRRKVDHPATKSVNTTKQSFRKGQRKALGVAQVMLGLFFIAIGIPLFQSPPSIASDAAIPWWGGGFFIISGFMSIYAERKLTYLILRCCAVSNLLSAAASLSAFLLFAMDLRKWVPHVTCGDKVGECKSEYVNLSEITLKRERGGSDPLFTPMVLLIDLCSISLQRMYNTVMQLARALVVPAGPPSE